MLTLTLTLVVILILSLAAYTSGRPIHNITQKILNPIVLNEVDVKEHCRSYKCKTEATALFQDWATNEAVTGARGLNTAIVEDHRVNLEEAVKCEEYYTTCWGYGIKCTRNSQRVGSGSPTACVCDFQQTLAENGLTFPIDRGDYKGLVPRSAGTKITIPGGGPVATKMYEYQANAQGVEWACWFDIDPAIALRDCQSGSPDTASPIKGTKGTMKWHSHPSGTDRVYSPPSSEDAAECAVAERKMSLVTEKWGTYVYYWHEDVFKDHKPEKIQMELAVDYQEYFKLIGLDEVKPRATKHHPPLLTRPNLIAAAGTWGFMITYFPKGSDISFYLPAQ